MIKKGLSAVTPKFFKAAHWVRSSSQVNAPTVTPASNAALRHSGDMTN